MSARLPGGRTLVGRLARSCAALGVVAGTLAPLAARAQSTGGTAAEPWELSDGELDERGWEYNTSDQRPGSVGGGLLGLVPLHGLGHWYNDDTDAAEWLLLSQGASLLLVATGWVLHASGDNDGFHPIASYPLVGGAGLFAAGWIGDVVGGFNGSTVPLPVNTRELRGVALELDWTTVLDRGPGVSSIGVLRVPIVGERFALRPGVQLGTDLGYQRYALEGAWRIPIGPRSRVELSVAGHEEIVEEVGNGSTGFGARAGVSLDAGLLVPHLSGLVWTTGFGATTRFLHFASDGGWRLDPAWMRWYFPVDVGVSLNVTEGINATLGYAHRPDELVGAWSDSFGVATARLGFVPSGGTGIDVSVEQGEWTRIWVGLRWFFVGGEVR